MSEHKKRRKNIMEEPAIATSVQNFRAANNTDEKLLAMFEFMVSSTTNQHKYANEIIDQVEDLEKKVDVQGDRLSKVEGQIKALQDNKVPGGTSVMGSSVSQGSGGSFGPSSSRTPLKVKIIWWTPPNSLIIFAEAWAVLF